jgi:hypothetical protein
MKTEVTPYLRTSTYFLGTEREYRIKWSIVSLGNIEDMEIIVKKLRG